jgi:Holliday junction DNA helicase RuvA
VIAGLRGTIYRTTTDAIQLDVGGVIYLVSSSTRSIADAGEPGSTVHMYTHLVVREDALTLFGFLTESELSWFQTLITVNGVGPRLACAVLSKLSPDQLIKGIAEEDVNLLSTVPGVGKRTASRILLDLRGKLPDNLEVPAVVQIEDTDTMAALRALGYTAAESQAAVSRLNVDASATPEERVIAALRQLGSG